MTDSPPNPDDLWFVQRGESRFSAPDFHTLTRWCHEGRVLPRDLIHHRSFGEEWRVAATIPDLTTAFQGVRRGVGGRPLLLVGVGCVVLVVATIGLLIMSALFAPSDTFQATVLDAGGRGSHAYVTARIKNISKRRVENASIQAWWADDRNTDSNPQVVTLDPGAEMTLRFTGMLSVSDTASMSDLRSSGDLTRDMAEVAQRQRDTFDRFRRITEDPSFRATASSGKTLWVKKVRE